MIYGENQTNQFHNNAEYERFNSDGTKKGKKAKSKKPIGIIVLLLVAILAVLAANSMVVTKENQYKLVRQFGRVQRVISQAGLSFKTPFIESVDTIPNELLLYDLPASDVITSDKKSMIVDSYVLWRITDPLTFAQTLSCSVSNAERRIDTIVYNATKNTISNMKQDEVIMSRDGKMTITVEQTDTDVANNDLNIQTEAKEVIDIKSLTEEIMEQINHVEEQYGIEIVTVEVKKLDLPDDNKQAVYTRMISERENIAAQYTAEGASQAKMIENTTDKEVAIMISDAQAQAEAIIAEGEAEYMRILSAAYADPEKTDFYSFVRALDALKASMTGDNKTVILSDDSPIAQIFNGSY
ncbi:MAG: protease modulator HflC [Bacillus sp. (in: Bacteria)]|nr:protease modulator HflC [Bacillus sp. (in: firmicutes)]MCM1427020.1 protease modulator HflC [Eubacterium sp.]